MRYLEDGRHDSPWGQGFSDAYFFDPIRIEPFLSKFGLETLRIMATEGLGALVEDRLMQLSEEDFQNRPDLFEAIAANPVIRGSCEHLLYIGREGGFLNGGTDLSGYPAA